jgi:hypothetical protein
MAEALEPFIHEQLPLNFIRLIHLSPSSLNPEGQPNSLQCDIRTRPFKNAPPYEALSYVWGDASITHDPITTNLHAALERFRSLPPPEYLWIDQLCINQADDEERSRQVNMMGSIFGRAQRVIMWLGPDPQGYGRIAHDFIQQMNRRENDYIPRPPLLSGELSQNQNLSVLGSEEWTSVQALAKLPYFERALILQEVGFARSKTILWGDQTLEWTEFAAFAAWLRGNSSLVGTVSLPLSVTEASNLCVLTLTVKDWDFGTYSCFQDRKRQQMDATRSTVYFP